MVGVCEVTSGDIELKVWVRYGQDLAFLEVPWPIAQELPK